MVQILQTLQAWPLGCIGRWPGQILQTLPAWPLGSIGRWPGQFWQTLQAWRWARAAPVVIVALLVLISLGVMSMLTGLLVDEREEATLAAHQRN